MANIVLCYPPIISTINSSLRLAREMREDGHNVSYMGIPDCENIICSNAFDFFSVYEQWFPKGWFVESFLKSQSPCDADNNIKKEISKKFDDFVEFLLNGGERDLYLLLQKVNPDIILISSSGIDSIIWALLIHKMNYKCIYVFDVLGGVVNMTNPPVCSELKASKKPLSSFNVLSAWLDFIIKIIKYDFLTKDSFRALSYKNVIRLAKYAKYPYWKISFFSDMPSPQLWLPELVLFPKKFEFPSVKKRGRYYTHASIDLNRTQHDFSWEKVVDTEPLVYVALGTLPLLSESDYKNFFQIIIDASVKWPSWNWVISIGDNLSMDDFTLSSSNVIIVNRAPQLELLKKASLMIAHGGANSIKECILFGVPMIIFPLWFDQPGNAARVSYHGLGLKADFCKINVNDLQGMIEEVMHEPEYRENVRNMQNHFVSVENSRCSIRLIERFIGQPSIPPFLK